VCVRVRERVHVRVCLSVYLREGTCIIEQLQSRGGCEAAATAATAAAMFAVCVWVYLF